MSRSQLAFDTMGKLLSDLGLIESLDKACPPSTSMTYLGVLFDTNSMCMYVDPAKLVELKSELSNWVRRTVAKKIRASKFTRKATLGFTNSKI